VDYFDNAAKALGIVFLRFDNEEQMHHLLNEITNEIEIVLEQENK